ncbi:ABC transporter permease [Chitinophagaceae bacterium LWZ2-11]
MFKNYFKIAWRNILRNKVNSTINIVGLAIGIASAVLIFIYIQDEFKYDKFFSKSDRIYMVSLDGNTGGQQFFSYNTPPTVGPALQQTFPEIESYARVYKMGDEVISGIGEKNVPKNFTEKQLMAVDSNFFQVLDYPMVEGSVSDALVKPHSVVLTQAAAKKYFGNTSAIGKVLTFDEYLEPFTVTAVLKDLPGHSSLQFNMLIPTSACPPVKRFSWSWVWCQMHTFVVLRKDFAGDKNAIAKLESKFPNMVKTQAANAFARIGKPLDEFYKKGGKWDFHLQPLKSVHLNSAGISSSIINTMGSIKDVYIFACIGLFIIMLACVNFMNLSTAQATRRAKEVGVRKVLGSLKKQLIKQFLTEAMLFSFISAAIGIFLVALLLPLFNTVAFKAFTFGDIFSNGIWLFVVLLALAIGLLAGSYPAFYLTSFKPALVLKGSQFFKKSGIAGFIRNGLVVFQFTVSIALIVCTLVVFNQLKYTRNKDLGLQRDNVLIVPNVKKLDNEQQAFRQELTNIQGVETASLTSGVPARDFSQFTDFYVPDVTGVKENLAKDITLTSFLVDENFVPSLHFRLLQGRNFSKEYNDSTSVIVNEETVKKIGWTNPIGKFITYPGRGDQRFQVIGVVKDFNVESLRSDMMPFAFFHTSSKTYYMQRAFVVASLKEGNPERIIKQIEAKWKTFAPDVPFEYSFLDQDYEALYRSEQRMGTVFGIFTCLSILVACLGLFGLSVYTAERRTKEIGIRKVLGASVQNVVGLLSKEFIKLVLVAAVIAFPLSWWLMNKWLQDFAYRITIGWQVFLIAGCLGLLIALITVSFQAFKAAVANPVKSLRTE